MTKTMQDPYRSVQRSCDVCRDKANDHYTVDVGRLKIIVHVEYNDGTKLEVPMTFEGKCCEGSIYKRPSHRNTSLPWYNDAERLLQDKLTNAKNSGWIRLPFEGTFDDGSTRLVPYSRVSGVDIISREKNEKTWCIFDSPNAAPDRLAGW